MSDVGTQSNQSEYRKPQQKSTGFVFYPSESSSDLAFSVNLRNIAKHYVHDERTKNALRTKADEHVTRDKNTFKHQKNIEMAVNNVMGSERNLGSTQNRSRLDQLLKKNRAHPSHESRPAQSGKRSETFRKLVTIYIFKYGILLCIYCVFCPTCRKNRPPWDKVTTIN